MPARVDKWNANKHHGMADCVECGAPLTLHEDVETGQIVDCGACGAELEVVDSDPLVVDRAPDIQDDWGE